MIHNSRRVLAAFPVILPGRFPVFSRRYDQPALRFQFYTQPTRGGPIGPSCRRIAALQQKKSSGDKIRPFRPQLVEAGIRLLMPLIILVLNGKQANSVQKHGHG